MENATGHVSKDEAIQYHLDHLTRLVAENDRFVAIIGVPREDGIECRVTTWQFPHVYYEAAIQQIREHLESFKARPAAPSPLPAADIGRFLSDAQSGKLEPSVTGESRINQSIDAAIRAGNGHVDEEPI